MRGKHARECLIEAKTDEVRRDHEVEALLGPEFVRMGHPRIIVMTRSRAWRICARARLRLITHVSAVSRGFAHRASAIIRGSHEGCRRRCCNGADGRCGGWARSSLLRWRDADCSRMSRTKR